MCMSAVRRVERLEEEGRVAVVEGAERRVSLDLLVVQGTRVGPGDWLLVSAGTAVSALEPETAADLLKTHRELEGSG